MYCLSLFNNWFNMFGSGGEFSKEPSNLQLLQLNLQNMVFDASLHSTIMSNTIFWRYVKSERKVSEKKWV